MVYAPTPPVIYVVTNRVNGKRYVGMTVQPLIVRWRAHLKGAATGMKGALYNAMRQYGVDEFVVQPIASLATGVLRDKIGELERLLISQEKTLAPNGYNLTPGGGGAGRTSHRKGKSLSAEHRAKLSAAWSDERKMAFRDRMARKDVADAQIRGRSTEAYRARQSEIRIERNRIMNQTPEHKARLKAAWARNPERRLSQAENVRKMMRNKSAPDGVSYHG